MGGKTGTARELKSEKGNYLVSFIGFAPLDKPEVVIYAVVDTPNVEEQASSTYPQYLAQAIISELLPYIMFHRMRLQTEKHRLQYCGKAFTECFQIMTDSSLDENGRCCGR